MSGSFAAERQQVPAEAAHQRRGSALNVPTKNVLNSMPFQPPCSRDFTGKPLFDDPDVAEAVQQRAELARRCTCSSTGASSCSSGTFISFDSAFSHEMRL